MRFHALRGSSLATLACVLAGSLVLSAGATTGGGDTPAADGSSGSEAREPLARGLDYAANPDHLGPRLPAALEDDSGFRHAQRLRQQSDQGLIGLALDESGADAHLQDRSPFSVDVPAVDAVGGGTGGEADG